jgi:hypothetical protein
VKKWVYRGIECLLVHCCFCPFTIWRQKERNDEIDAVGLYVRNGCVAFTSYRLGRWFYQKMCQYFSVSISVTRFPVRNECSSFEAQRTTRRSHPGELESWTLLKNHYACSSVPNLWQDAYKLSIPTTNRFLQIVIVERIVRSLKSSCQR